MSVACATACIAQLTFDSTAFDTASADCSL